MTLATEALAAPPTDLLTGASLFLDFDGTLVELAERPDGVEVGPRLLALLGRLAERLDGRLALVSGRAAGELALLLGSPDVTISGSHGLEMRYRDGRVVLVDRPAALDDAKARMLAFAHAVPGLYMEDKPLGAALHYRLVPDAEAECLALAAPFGDAPGVQLQAGKMMIEVRASGGDKGSAIRSLMEEPAMAGTRPVFLGDDLTDEPGFTAAAALGGAGILVGADRGTAARYRLDDVAGVLAWLEEASA